MAGDNLINQLSQEEAEKLLLEKKSNLKVRENHEILEKAIEESGISLLILLPLIIYKIQKIKNISNKKKKLNYI